VAAILAQTPEVCESLHVQADAALASLDRTQTLMVERFSPDLVVDLAAVRGMVAGVKSLLPASQALAVAEVDSGATTATDAAAVARAPSRQGGGVHSIETRQDAVRAIELACAYLERSEPTNPAQLLLRRAARLINKDFLQLVRELAPDAVADVARIMGVDPDTVNDQN
jgi:type VI secretion system protein ImpA